MKAMRLLVLALGIVALGEAQTNCEAQKKKFKCKDPCVWAKRQTENGKRFTCAGPPAADPSGGASSEDVEKLKKDFAALKAKNAALENQLTKLRDANWKKAEVQEETEDTITELGEAFKMLWEAQAISGAGEMCMDNPMFKDVEGYGCSAWEGYHCGQEGEECYAECEDEYEDDRPERCATWRLQCPQVRLHCPVACGLCENQYMECDWEGTGCGPADDADPAECNSNFANKFSSTDPDECAARIATEQTEAACDAENDGTECLFTPASACDADDMAECQEDGNCEWTFGEKECEAGDPPAFPEASWVGCEWETGDNVAGEEVMLGLVDSPQECVDLVREKCPRANGASLEIHGQGECWCEYDGFDVESDDDDWRTCKFSASCSCDDECMNKPYAVACDCPTNPDKCKIIACKHNWKPDSDGQNCIAHPALANCVDDLDWSDDFGRGYDCSDWANEDCGEYNRDPDSSVYGLAEGMVLREKCPAACGVCTMKDEMSRADKGQCMDDMDWIDKTDRQYTCDDWRGDDCGTEYRKCDSSRYTFDMCERMRKKCPAACGLCDSCKCIPKDELPSECDWQDSMDSKGCTSVENDDVSWCYVSSACGDAGESNSCPSSIGYRDTEEGECDAVDVCAAAAPGLKNCKPLFKVNGGSCKWVKTTKKCVKLPNKGNQ